MQRGMAAASIARFSEAAANTARATELAPENDDAWFHHASMLELNGRFAEAVAAYDKTLALNPDRNVARARRERVPLQYADRVAEMNRQIASNPQGVRSWRAKADFLSDLGRFDLALPDYDQALRLAPEDGFLWNQRGWCLNMLGDPKAAIVALRRATALAPENPNTWGNMSGAYNQMGDFENGRVFGERALQADPNHLQSLSNLGSALLNLDHPVEALVFFDRALAIQPSLIRWVNKAVALMRLNRLIESLECVEQALTFDPNDHQVQQLKRMLTLQLGE
jgi:tetratricopeptide (TPR) repeat protein